MKRLVAASIALGFLALCCVPGHAQSIANVKDYGATGNGRAVTHAVAASGNTVLVDATDSPWVAGDAGKVIVLYGQTYAGQVTSIVSVTDSAHIVLAAAPSSSATVNAVWGTDDSTAVSNAVAAITANGSLGVLYFPQGIYLVGSPLSIINAQGLEVSGDGAASGMSLGNYNVPGQPGTGSAIVWIGGIGGAIGCTGNTGVPPPGIDSAATNCTAAENMVLKLSGQFSLRDLAVIGTQRASHTIQVGGVETSNSFVWRIERVNAAYARQYGLVVGGTGADEGSNFGEASIRDVQLGGNGIPNTTVAENDATGGGDIFFRIGPGNFQVKLDSGFIGGGSGVNGNHRVFAYTGNFYSFNNVYFAPVISAIHSSVYVRQGNFFSFDNVYDENGWMLHAASGDSYHLSQVQMRQQVTTNPHVAAVFDASSAVDFDQVSTAGLPIVFKAGGRVKRNKVGFGNFGSPPAYPFTLCSGAGCITRSGSDVTVTTTTTCTYAVNDWIALMGIADATYNGIFKVTAGCLGGSAFHVTNAAAAGASTQAGTVGLACCIIAETTTGYIPQYNQPFVNYLETIGAGTLSDQLYGAVTDLANKNAIVMIPSSIAGSVGSSVPAAIPAGFHFLDFRGGNPTYLGGPFQWGTSLNFARLGINTADLRTPSAALDVNSPSGTPAAAFHVNGSDEYSVVFNTDSGATARLLSQNNGTPFWEIDFFHGANKQFAIQSQTKTFLLFSDTNNTTSLGTNTSTVNTVYGSVNIVERAAPSGAGGIEVLWADSTAHRLKVKNNNGGATTLAQFADKLSVFAATSSAELAGVLSDETGTGAAVFAADPVMNRIKVSGAAPTCTFTSGGGTSPSCGLQAGSTDTAGVIIATTGTGSPGNLGTITLTFSASFGTNTPACAYTLSNAGAGQWNARATVIDKTPASGSDLFNWDNNAVALGTSKAYQINYHCIAK